mgnify:CR=1 FL=1
MEEAARVGLDVLVKPHVWVPERWAGSVVFSSESDWPSWFDAYESALVDCAETAAEAGADGLSVGTALLQPLALIHIWLARRKEKGVYEACVTTL